MPPFRPPEDAVPKTLPLGWREWLALPDLGITAVRAKVDTGARSSSLHVDSQETFDRDGVEWVRFELDTGRYHAPHAYGEAPVLARRKVTDSGGHRTERIFIRTRMRLAGLEWLAEVNLAQRRNMLFPMLLGRTALAGRFVVDPAASFLQGEHAPVPTK
ncbi:ATP-dependent zinc protease [Arenimonas aestuarii]